LFTYLGPARVEKGFHLMPDAIAILNRQYPDARFAVQSVMHDHRAIKAKSELVRKTGHVEVIDHSLASEDYYRLLSDSQCVLLPYDPKAYYGRTSGIFAEALAFGKPVITTRGTWMARYVDRYRCGVLMDGYNPEKLSKAMGEYAGNREFYDRNAREASGPWREYHNPKNYLETVFALAGNGTGIWSIPQTLS
jgi:glycosyltransferase involved in cell wall biosynthesis